MNHIVDTGERYQSYRGLPPLAGLSSIPDAIRGGLSVDKCVGRLKRFHYALKRLHRVFNDHVTSEPIYELKMAFSLHSHYCAEHVSALRKRVSEMREPPLGLDKVPCAHLEVLFDEILSAATTEERLVAIYEIALPAIVRGMERHIEETHPLTDHPSIRQLRFALLELREMVSYGEAAVPCLIEESDRKAMSQWVASLDRLLALSGDLDGTQPAPVELAHEEIPRTYSARPYQYNREVRRDERFGDPYNMGVNAEVYLNDERYDPGSKVIMMFYKRLREIDVPEMMASIIAETEGKPWKYYHDMTRQLWDEARHAMMGELGFISLGIDWKKVPINFTWSRGLNMQLEPLERHAVLYFIEQGLMPKSGKRHEWEVGVASHHPLAANFQDYDWADEVLHAHIGREWYVGEIGDARKAIDYGDECWSKVLMDWGKWKRDGLTEHSNWWPEIYREACERAGIEPDPAALGYCETYENRRADLRVMAAE